jgi:hypothetical protein
MNRFNFAVWLFGRSVRHKKTQSRFRCLPETEMLEDRLAPAHFAPTFVLYQPADGMAPMDGSATPSGTTPSQMRTAYGVNLANFGGITGDGTGQTIAIVDA